MYTEADFRIREFVLLKFFTCTFQGMELEWQGYCQKSNLNIFGGLDLLVKLDCFLDFDFELVGQQLDLYWFPLQVVPRFGQPVLKLFKCLLIWHVLKFGYICLLLWRGSWLLKIKSSQATMLARQRCKHMLCDLTVFEITECGNKWDAKHFYEMINAWRWKVITDKIFKGKKRF